MENKILGYSLCGIFMLSISSCSIDKAYDLSKDIDMTIAVGKGVSLPLGSTEKIMLTEMIDPSESDVIEVNDDGFYSIKKTGEISETTVKINSTSVTIEPVSQEEIYPMDIVEIDENSLDKYPPSVREQIENAEHTHIMEEKIDDSKVEYKIDEDVPDEMTLLRYMKFSKPVKMSLDIDIFTVENSSSDAIMLNKLHLHTDGADGNEHFYVQMPKYLVFSDGTSVNEENKLWLDAVIEHDFDKGHKHFTHDYYIEALDFSYYEGGGIPVVDGRITDDTELEVRGMIYSDPMTFTLNDIPELHNIHVCPEVRFEPFEIESVVGYFEPEIDDVNETIEIDLGEDMDFIYDATLDFTNPQIKITLNNDGVTVPVKADVALNGYNKYGNYISGSMVGFALDVLPDTDNNYYITEQGASLEGYTSVSAELNNILNEIPHEIKLSLQAEVDNSKGFNEVVLGKDMKVSGSYELDIPMEFEELDLTYTETIEDVLGDDPSEVTDYVTDISSVTLNLEVLNTVPATFTPDIIAKSADGRVLDKVKAVFDGQILAGRGMENGKVTEPVKSTISINLSATDNQLKDLNTLDIEFNGIGDGILNENEYIQITKITITIDEPIIVDMN